MISVDHDAGERRIAEQHAMPLEDIRILHRKDVRRAAPLGARERERRRIARVGPRPRSGRRRGQVLRVQSIDNDENVVIGTLGDVLSRCRGTVEDDRAQRATVGRAQLRDEFVECHSRHGHQDPLEPPPPNPPPPPKPPNPPPPPPNPPPPPKPPPPQPPPPPPIGMKIGKQ